MPKKKGKKGKGKKKGKKSKVASGPARPAFDYEPVTIATDEMIHLNIKLVSWSYLDFAIRVPLDTSLFLIRKMIQERHGGSITDILVYKHCVHPDNMVYADEAHTLRSLGYIGSADKSTIREGILFYDYRPDFLAVDKNVEIIGAPDPRLHPQGSPYMTQTMRSAAGMTRIGSARRREEMNAPFATPAAIAVRGLPPMMDRRPATAKV